LNHAPIRSGWDQNFKAVTLKISQDNVM